MTEQNEQIFAAAMMTAAADILVGEPGHAEALNNHVSVMFGPPVNFPTMLHWGECARESRRPMLHFHFFAEANHLPLVTLVDFRDGRTNIFECCFLWLGKGGRGAHVIPDNFKSGAYVIDRDLSLKHLKRPPVPNLAAAEDGLVEASLRLCHRVTHHRENAGALRLPEQLDRKAA